MMMSKDDKKLLSKHANRHITMLLDKLGVVYTQHGTLLQAACPCEQHGGDGNNQTAFSWRTDIGFWVCWSHHCNDNYGNDIFGLIRSVLDIPFANAIKWLQNSLNDADVDLKASVVPPENAWRGTTLHIHDPLDESQLKWLTPHPQLLIDRGFDCDVLDEYQVGFWSKLGTFMHDRVVIPVRDHDSHLVGYTARTIHDRDWFDKRGIKYAKWLHGRHYHRFPKTGEFLTSSVLFNLHRARKHLGLQRKMILVEGPLDGFKLEMAGIHNWVATLSTSFGPVHKTLLVRYGVTELLCAYDNDVRKQIDKPTSSEKAWTRMEKYVGDLFHLHRVSLPVGRDLGAMNVPEIKEIFSF